MSEIKSESIGSSDGLTTANFSTDELADERQVFEQWAHSMGYNTHRDGTEKYLLYHRASTRFAREGWLSALTWVKNTVTRSSDGEREAFEAEQIRHVQGYSNGQYMPHLERTGHGYQNPLVHAAWQGWQARAALSSDREMAPEAKSALEDARREEAAKVQRHGDLPATKTEPHPLEDDGDALRLAVRLGLLVDVRYRTPETQRYNRVTYWPTPAHGVSLEFGDRESDGIAATRRAIVRAAAELATATVDANEGTQS